MSKYLILTLNVLAQRRRSTAEPGDERVFLLLADVLPCARQALLEVRSELEMALRFLRRSFATFLLFRILKQSFISYLQVEKPGQRLYLGDFDWAVSMSAHSAWQTADFA